MKAWQQPKVSRLIQFLSFNIQYSKGADNVFDLERIADVIGGADIVGLQEVARNMPGIPDADQPARLAELLPDYYHVFHASVDIAAPATDSSAKGNAGRIQFGNMIFSRWPIISTRAFALPWAGLSDEFDMQNTVIEAVIDCPGGALRVYVTHLNFRRAAIRRRQLEWLVPKLFQIEREGIGLSGESWMGITIPPSPKSFVVLGDFNLTPSCGEYEIIVGESDFYYGRMVNGENWVDSWSACGNDESNSVTWYDHDNKNGTRLDYGFVSPNLAKKVSEARIDHDCSASDHQPYWFKLAW